MWQNPVQNDKFIRSVKEKDYQAVEGILKKRDFNINKQYNTKVHDSTVLHYAAHKGDVKMVEILLAHKADVNLPTVLSKIYPLHYAAMSGSVDTITLLLSHKVNINKADGIGRTALHLAVINNREEATEFLIKKGSDVNSVNSMGRTALHWAAFWGRPQCADSLLQNGANADLRDNNGDTALTIAEKCYQRSTAVVILDMKKTSQDEVESNKVEAVKGNDVIEECTVVSDVITKSNTTVNIDDKSGYTPVIALVSADRSHVIVPQVEQGATSSTVGISYIRDDRNNAWTIPSHFITHDHLNTVAMPTTGRPSEIELNRIAGQIGFEWSSIALELGIPLKQVEQFEMAFPRDPRRQIVEMLIKWRLKVQDRSEVERCEILRNALLEEGRRDLSEML